MTGATGDLTPESRDDAFDPGERREIEGAEHHANVTVGQAHRAAAQAGEVATPQEPLGSEDRTHPEGSEPASDRGPRIGGDELADHDEHF